MSKWGFVYCLSNDSMPGVYKVGFTTTSPFSRAAALSCATGVAEPFNVMFYIDSAIPYGVEKEIHEALDEFRVSGNREFFRVDIQKIFEIFRDYSSAEHSAMSVSYAYHWRMADIDFEHMKREKAERSACLDG